MKAQLISDLAKRLYAALPASTGVQTAANDIKSNFKAILQATLTKFDLVSREELDVQLTLLANTRKKLEQLEQQVAVLEQSLQKND
jgi:BMFP domain-containing protein YqiC